MNDSPAFPIDKLTSDCRRLGLALTEKQAGQFEQYARLLLEWNQKMNLTAITEPEAVAVKHFADSLTLLAAVSPSPGAKLLDVGAGAGFPSVPVGILRPDLRLTLLDSLNKRLTFLDALTRELSLPAELLHRRAEEAAGLPEYREQYDLACARAVARMSALSEYCLPFVRPGGVFVALKGPDGPQELEEAAGAVALLGGGSGEIHSFTLSDGSERCVIVVQKVRPTPTKYPRKGTKITKMPL